MQPVIIIGAGRSGTNMLRDILTTLPEVGTWPCDEINYIWRYSNAKYPVDELLVEHATPKVKKYIGNAFEKISRQQRVSHVLEKTCANSLRVPFVDAVFPNAKYIFIVRDGRDVVASAMKRWTASLDIPYLMRKARYVPFADLPYYASRYAGNRVYRLFSNEERLAFWGPRFQGMQEALTSRSLAEVCALQWRACVTKSADYLDRLPQERVHKIKYEVFVQQPQTAIRELGQFLQQDINDTWLKQAVEGVSTSSINKWRTQLSEEDHTNIMPILQGVLAQYDYKNVH